MYVKDKKAYASLTEVKNKLGDVFALADEHGEVYISSYNKPKYIISRIHNSKHHQVQVEEVKVEAPVMTKKELKFRKSSTDNSPRAAKDWSRTHHLEHGWVKKVRN
jgi:hypothetical protein